MRPLLLCLLLKGRQCERDSGWVWELFIWRITLVDEGRKAGCLNGRLYVHKYHVAHAWLHDNALDRTDSFSPVSDRDLVRKIPLPVRCQVPLLSAPTIGDKVFQIFATLLRTTQSSHILSQSASKPSKRLHISLGINFNLEQVRMRWDEVDYRFWGRV